MALSITTTQVGANEDYEPYLYGAPTKTDRYKDGVLMDFTLAPADTSFQKLLRGTYITFQTTTYGKWFTGYITNEPSLEALGSKSGVVKWGYKYQATSDDYILSLKPIGLIPPFLNVTAGEIVRSLVSRLAPGIFNVAGVADGPVLAQYTIDTDKKFADVIKELCEAISFNFYANDKHLYFASVDSATTITLDGSNAHFTPRNLTIGPAESALVNDALVVGDIEAQKYVTEYLVGTGLDSLFPLAESVYGADKTVYIDENFEGAAISQSWEVFDNSPAKFAVSNGYLNITGGSLVTAINLRSKNPIPLDGFLRLTHGEWHFISGNAVIGGLWSTTPSATDSTDLIYGISKSAGFLYPVVNGVDDLSNPVTISSSMRYVIRTIADIRDIGRKSQPFTYTNINGVVTTVSAVGTALVPIFTTLVTEIDPATGEITNQHTFSNVVSLSGVQQYAYYSPVLSYNLSATVTGITVSVPVSASLEMADRLAIKNNGFDNWTDGELDAWYDGHHVTEDVGVSGSGIKLTQTSGENAYIKYAISSIIKANTQYELAVRLKKSSTAVGPLNIYFEYDDDMGTHDISGFSVEALSGITHISDYGVYYGILTNGLVSVPDTLRLVIAFIGAADDYAVYLDDLNIQTPFEVKIVGPNELDANDGLAPAATIISAQSTTENRNSATGLPQFTAGVSQLAFFKDSVNRTSTIPLKDQIIKITYRSAGPAVGRAIDYPSKLEEAIRWGDDGTRNVTRGDLVPRPRTSLECEAAASAIVSQNSRVRYQGQYYQYSSYFSVQPISGFLLAFANIPDVTNNSEVITQVVTTMDHGATEVFRHTLSFGPVDQIRKLLNKFTSYDTTFQKPDTPNIKINPSSVSVVGSQYAPSIIAPYIKGWDNADIYVNIGQSLGSGLHFELRGTDDSWGVDDGNNLIDRVTSGTDVNVPRYLRGRTIYMRQVNPGNRLFNSETFTAAQYTTTGGTTNMVRDTDENLNTVLVGDVNLTSAGSIRYNSYVPPSVINHAFSFSVKAATSADVGKQLTVSFMGTSIALVTLASTWQRVTAAITPFTTAPIIISSSVACNFRTTKWSAEAGTLYEKMYSRTTTSLYGPTSRHSTVLNVSFPVQETDNIDEIIDQLPPGATPPDDVTDLVGSWDWALPSADLTTQVALTVEYDAPDDLGLFTGVQAYWYLEDGIEHPGGSHLYPGTDPGTVTILIPAPNPPQDVAVKLTSRANNYENSTGPSVTIANVGGSLNAPNATAITVTAIYENERWGFEGSISFPVDRSGIDYCRMFIVGPYHTDGSDMGDATIARLVTEFDAPASGDYPFSIPGSSYERWPANQKFKVVVETYNYLNVATASPLESALFQVNAVDITTQATACSASAVYYYTVDGASVFRISLGWTNASDDDFERTEIYLQEDIPSVGLSARQLYTATGPHGVGGGFAQTYQGTLVDLVPATIRNFVMSFVTISVDGSERTPVPTASVSVDPNSIGAIGKLNAVRIDPAKIAAEFGFPSGLFGITNLGITDTKIAANAITTPKLSANAVTTTKLDANQIDVGGGGSKPARFRIYNAANAIIGWIGTDTSGFSPFQGAWFQEFRVGGTNPTTAKLASDSFGNLTISGGTFTLNLNGYTTTISNVSDFTYGVVGFQIQTNFSNERTILTSTAHLFLNSSANPVVQLSQTAGNGFMALRNSSSQNRVVFNGGNTGLGIGLAEFYDTSSVSRFAIDTDGYMHIKLPAAPAASAFVEWVWIKVNGNFRKIPAYF